MRRTASASLVGSWCVAVLRFPHCSVSGLPLLCLTSCIPCPVAPSGQALRGSPQFCDASLPACHGLRTPADLPRLALAEVRVWPSGACKPSASAMSLFAAVPALQGARSPLRPPGDAVDAAPILCAVRLLTTPPWTQDSLRVGGWPFPDKDLHLARDAKLILARERRASGAAGGRSGAQRRVGCKPSPGRLC
jgi:hypothetical protein